MKRVLRAGGILFLMALLVLSIRDAGAQRRYYDAPRGLYNQQLERRVAELERRVERLERLLPADARTPEPVTVGQAERQVANAQARLAYSEELFRKGYISRVQLEAERWESRRAEKMLQLAQASRDGDSTKQRETTAAIELLDAEYDLEVAEIQLKVAVRMSAGGFKDSTGIEGYRQAVDAARKRLEAARAQPE